MSDNLRDRIAAVLLPSANYCQQSMTRPCDDCMESARKKADAVIRELGWREEKAVKNSAFKPPLINTYATPEAAVDDIDRAPPHVKQDLRLVHRYVTEWENNDE